jgi:hypothetical protein
MAYNEEVVSRQYPVVLFFVQHLAYFQGLKATVDRITNHKAFWTATVDGYLKLATIAWCKVFGSRKEDLHWAKTPTGNIPKQAKDDFRQRVLSHTGFTHEQWETYHTKMLTFRDKYVAHLDLNKPFNEPVPSFDPALQIAYAYEEWAKELTQSVTWGQPTLSSVYKKGRDEASSIVSQRARRGRG